MLDWVFSFVTPSTLMVFTLVLMLTYYVQGLPWSLNMPPGPFPLPVLGNIRELMKKPAPDDIHVFQTLASKYGKIFSLKLGPVYSVVISDYQTLVDTFVKQPDVFSDRPADDFYAVKYVNSQIHPGLLTNSGHTWKMFRRASAKTMRYLGVGKQSLEEKIQEEIRIVLDILDQKRDKPFCVKHLFNMATSNVVCQIIFGARFDYEDEKFKTLMKNLHHSTTVNPIEMSVNFFPFLRHIPYFQEQVDRALHAVFVTTEYVKSLVLSNEATYDPENIRDFVDLFIKMKKDNADNDSYDDTGMARVIVDMFVAGSDTTATVLSWSLLFMAEYPEIQKKCQREIDLVLGKGKIPSVSDRDNLPYVEATIFELLRYRPITPIGLPHKANRDVTIRGYHIPKDTTVFSNLIGISMDPVTFPNPEKFDPGHFLDKEGKLINRDRLVSFSIGPRVCLGENIAKMEFLLFFVAILQFFTISPEPGKPVELYPAPEALLYHKVQNIVLSRRE